MRLVLVANGHTDVGGTSLVTHNERLVDPLDEFVQALSVLTSKRKKTLDDHADIGRLEFYAGLYTGPTALTLADVEKVPKNGSGPVPVIPAVNVLRCLQEAGSGVGKLGKDVLRGVHLVSDYAELQYDGPKHPVKLYQDGGYMLRKSVGVQRARTMRTRPVFTEWSFRLPIEVDPHVFDKHKIDKIWSHAGQYCGLCEMRPVFGRFQGTVEEEVSK